MVRIYIYTYIVSFTLFVFFLIHFMFSYYKTPPGSLNRMSNTVYEVDFSTLETMDHYTPIVVLIPKKKTMTVTMIQSIISLQNVNNNGGIYQTWHENNSTGQILV